MKELLNFYSSYKLVKPNLCVVDSFEIILKRNKKMVIKKKLFYYLFFFLILGLEN